MPRRILPVFLGTLLLGTTACVRTFSTDIPVNYQTILEKRYVGLQAWTRQTLTDEKKNIKIEQDQEVTLLDLGMQRTGSVTVLSKQGHKRVVYPFRLARPLTLEMYEKTLLDVLWLESPEERFAKNKQKYGTRIAEAIRDHKILKDMPQFAAYLSWGSPSKVEFPEGTPIETWHYDTPNLAGARVSFKDQKVAMYDGENVQDTEAAKKKKSLRRSLAETAGSRQ